MIMALHVLRVIFYVALVCSIYQLRREKFY